MTPSNVGSIFCIVICIVQYGICWKNGYDLPLNFVCPANKMISYIRSVHNNVAEDRIWDFKCRRNPYGSNGCSWSGWVNRWDETFAFICPDKRYISGIRSYHNNQAEDRRHNFYCCKSRGKVFVHSCHFTSPNRFDTQIQQTVPYGYTWKGVISNHNNAAEKTMERETERLTHATCIDNQNNQNEMRIFPFACVLENIETLSYYMSE